MHILLTGIGLLLSGFLGHLLVWRIRLPKSHTRALLIIFAITPLAAFAAFQPVFSLALLHIALFYGSCAFVYIILYSLLEEESPTLSLMAFLQSANGATKEELQAHLATKSLLGRRLDSMTASGLIIRSDENYQLTPKGEKLAGIFTMAANIIGLQQGG